MTIDEAIEKYRTMSTKGNIMFPHRPDIADKSNMQYKQTADWLEELKHYKELEEQDRLIELPCGEGETVYKISTNKECKYNNDCPLNYCYKCEDGIDCEHFIYNRTIEQIEFNKYMVNVIGRTVFLTREEAEKKLEEMKNGK